MRPNVAAIAGSLVPPESQPLGALGHYSELEADVQSVKATCLHNLQLMAVRLPGSGIHSARARRFPPSREQANQEKARAVEGMAEEMVANAKSFQRASVHVRRKHCARHIRYKLLIGGCIAVALLIALSPFLPRHSS